MTAICGVEPLAKTGEDTNSNGQKLELLAGWHSNQGVLVNAGAIRRETVIDTEDRRFCIEIQAPIWGVSNFRRYAESARSRQGRAA